MALELKELPNIGPELARLLDEAGVHSAEELRTLGTQETFLRLKARDPDACFHKLTAIEGAVQGVRKSQIAPERKTQLRAFFDSLS